MLYVCARVTHVNDHLLRTILHDPNAHIQTIAYIELLKNGQYESP